MVNASEVQLGTTYVYSKVVYLIVVEPPENASVPVIDPVTGDLLIGYLRKESLVKE